MKRNQCIICFERISQTKDKISASHEDIKHDGWYHKSCIIEHIEYCKKNNKIVGCPLCRGIFIINIPNYEYSPNINIITNNNFETLENRFEDINVNIPPYVNVPFELLIYFAPPMGNRKIWLTTTTAQTCLIIRCFFRYEREFYITMYFYALFTFVLIINSIFVERNNYDRVRSINRWKLFTKVLIFILWYEFLYCIVKKIIDDSINMYKYGIDNEYTSNDTIEYDMIEDDIIEDDVTNEYEFKSQIF